MALRTPDLQKLLGCQRDLAWLKRLFHPWVTYGLGTVNVSPPPSHMPSDNTSSW